jgi:hypothetical protein
LISQLVGLERRVFRSGKDSIDHAPGGHDDVANAVAGLCSGAINKYPNYDPTFRAWQPGFVDEDLPQPTQPDRCLRLAVTGHGGNRFRDHRNRRNHRQARMIACEACTPRCTQVLELVISDETMNDDKTNDQLLGEAMIALLAMSIITVVLMLVWR